MTDLAPKPTSQITAEALYLALHMRRTLQHWEKLRRQHAAKADQPCRFYLGQRVRTTVDEFSRTIFGIIPAPAGTLGTIAMPEDEWGDYAVLLDTDPTRRHAFGENELEPLCARAYLQ